MSIYYWDIETSGLKPVASNDRVTIIGIMSESDEVTFFCDPDETKLLQEFWRWIREHRTDTLVGFNSLSFDYKFIIKRSIICDVEPYLQFRYKNFDLRNAIDENRFVEGTLQEYTTLIAGEQKFENLSGEEVIKLFHIGDYHTLKRYLAQDLVLTKILYTRLKKLGMIQ